MTDDERYMLGLDPVADIIPRLVAAHLSDDDISTEMLNGTVEISSSFSPLQVLFSVNEWLRDHDGEEAEMFDLLGRLKDFLA